MGGAEGAETLPNEIEPPEEQGKMSENRKESKCSHSLAFNITEITQHWRHELGVIVNYARIKTKPLHNQRYHTTEGC